MQEEPWTEPEKNSESFEVMEHVYQLYPNLPQYDLENKTIQKYEFLLRRFTQIYGVEPTYYVKSPGRAVLFGGLGSGYPTVEMCIPRDVIIVVAVNDHKTIRVNHFDKTKHPEKSISTEASQVRLSTEESADDYHNMLAMALKMCAAVSGQANFVSRGMDVFIFSDFLSKIKLANTSALAYGLVLAFLACNKLHTRLKRQQLVEQFHKWKTTFPQLSIGETQLYGQNNKLFVTPSRAQLNFPKEYTFVMANSLTPEPTKLTQGKRTNLRYCQILLGVELIKSQLGITKEFSNMRDLQHNLGYNTSDMIDCVEQSVPNRPLSASELEALIERPLIEVLRAVPFANVVLDQNTTFHPFKRMMYLLQEDKLIADLAVLIQSNRAQTEKCEQIGKLLTASQTITSELLEVRSKQIDKLLEVAGQSGFAYSHKLIGNGWGGNILFWLPQQHCEGLIDHLTQHYYMDKSNQILMSCECQQYLYEVVSSRGLSLLNPQYEMWF